MSVNILIFKMFRSGSRNHRSRSRSYRRSRSASPRRRSRSYERRSRSYSPRYSPRRRSRSRSRRSHSGHRSRSRSPMSDRKRHVGDRVNSLLFSSIVVFNDTLSSNVDTVFIFLDESSHGEMSWRIWSQLIYYRE